MSTRSNANRGSKQYDVGAKLSPLFARKKSDAYRRALVRPARRARIKQMDFAVDLVRGPVGVAEEKPVARGRQAPGQDMNQVKAFPSPVQVEAGWQIKAKVIITQYHRELGVDRA